MKELVQNEEYLLFIDKSAEIKGNDFCVNLDRRISHLPLKVEKRNIGGYGSDKYYFSHKKVIAYRKLNESAKELDLPELLPFENDKGLGKSLNEYIKDLHSQEECTGFIEGYKAAQAKQYSLEDIKNSITFGYLIGHSDGVNKKEIERPVEGEDFEEFIQSLSTQQLPKEFILGEGETIKEQIKNGHYKY